MIFLDFPWWTKDSCQGLVFVCVCMFTLRKTNYTMIYWRKEIPVGEGYSSGTNYTKMVVDWLWYIDRYHNALQKGPVQYLHFSNSLSYSWSFKPQKKISYHHGFIYTQYTSFIIVPESAGIILDPCLTSEVVPAVAITCPKFSRTCQLPFISEQSHQSSSFLIKSSEPALWLHVSQVYPAMSWTTFR